MRKIWSFALLVGTFLLLVVGGCGLKEDQTSGKATENEKEIKLVKEGKLTFAMSGLLKPLNYKENDKLVGFDVEIGKEIAKRIGLEANPVTNPWETILQGLKGNKYDAIIGSMTATEERAKQVDFSDPYYISGAQIFVSESNQSLGKKADLTDRKIGVVQSSTYQQDAEQYTKNIKSYPSDVYALQDLEPGRVDAVITDKIVGIHAMKEAGLKIKPVDKVLKQENIAVAVNKDNPILLAEINRAIASMVEDGTYKTISEKWFGVNLLEK
ncbi:ABC transporter substrate-binding protein [Bacillus badius]|uniref:ABC transporter substrate-binding protein n=1 Tax=Bacillus badius TaxID=1455 RepID=UPI000597A920|nr:ABC transporter substrate-binding protein [Bacillus badius]KIL74395.1 Cystine-binding periplasmic protein precursor [Bacillus badius]KZR58933.1 ABC transporter substrate-binding protein [Bacillus badius]